MTKFSTNIYWEINSYLKCIKSLSEMIGCLVFELTHALKSFITFKKRAKTRYNKKNITQNKTINWSLIKVLVNKLELIWKQCLRIRTKQIVMNCRNSCRQRSKAICHYIWGLEIRNHWSLPLMSTKQMPRLQLWFEFIFYFVLKVVFILIFW